MGVWTPSLGATGGNDQFTGDSSDETADGLGGDDTLLGNDGADTLTGNAGNDTLNGGAGDDTLFGGDDNDNLTDAGSEFINQAAVVSAFGGDGNDVISVGYFSSGTVNGGAGHDILSFYGDGNQSFVGLSLIGLEELRTGGFTATAAQFEAFDTISYSGDVGGGGIAPVLTLAAAGVLDLSDELIQSVSFHGSSGDDTFTCSEWGGDLFGEGGNDTLHGGSGIEYFYGGEGDDTANGAGGNDRFWGSAGADTFNGGDGVDWAVYDTSSSAVQVRLYGGLTIGGDATGDVLTDIENVIGSAYNDLLIGVNGVDNRFEGGFGNDELDGLTGDDVLNGDSGEDVLIGGYGADTLNGGTEADTLYGGEDTDTLVGGAGADSLDGGGGTADTASYANSGGGVRVSLLTGAGLDSDAQGDTLTGTENLTGSDFADQLTGSNGANFLIGGEGSDALAGLGGDDIYIVDDAGDVVTELANKGYDTVISAITWTLANHFELLSLGDGAGAINGTGNSADNLIFGNNAVNTLDGANGADTLNGGAGADTMLGGAGDDFYYVDNAGDVVSEFLNKGTDTVQSSVTLALGNHVENLTLTGAALNATGNSLKNIITGNANNNIIDGKAGGDTMTGGLGDDTYLADHINDLIVEGVGGGTDTVKTFNSRTLSDNVENLTLNPGTAAINGTGNALANVIRGNDAVNVIDGAGGNDLLLGGLGNDRLTGGAGADDFLFNTAAGEANRDTITDFNAADDTIRLDNAIFTALGANGALNADFFHAGAAAADANDYIIYANGSLLYDADGNGAGAAVRFAVLTGAPALTAADFIVT